MNKEYQNSFAARVRFDDEGNLLCFCQLRDPGAPVPECREDYDCPEARIEVAVVAGTRPSEQQAAPTKRALRNLEKELKGAARSVEKIKQGLLPLEQSIKKNPRFRI